MNNSRTKFTNISLSLDTKSIRPSVSTIIKKPNSKLIPSPPPRKAIISSVPLPQKLISSISVSIDATSPVYSSRDRNINYKNNMMGSLRKSLSFRGSATESEKLEISKKKMLEVENFKKNPRFSYLENNLNTEIDPEDLLEVAFSFSYLNHFFVGCNHAASEASTES